MQRPAAALACAILATACSDGVPAADVQAREQRQQEVSAAARSEASTQSADRVDLTVYYRRGRGRAAHLMPVVREVAVSQDLPRKALELLLQGPPRRDSGRLVAPLPQDTRVLHFAVEGDTAVVDLSSAARAAADPRPEHAVLAMAALANTLTEFPTIARLRLTVAGQRRARLWGGWRVPRQLTRDDAVIGPDTSAEALPAPGSFRRHRQGIGTAGAGRVTVTGVRVRLHAGFRRVAVELAPRQARDVGGEVPRSTARRVGNRLELVVRDVARVRSGSAARGRQAGVRVSVRHRHGRLRVTVRPGAERFLLHTLSDPTRVVLDART